MAFFYFDMALKGGETVLASSWQTYNDLAVNRPDVLHTLAEPWVLDTYVNQRPALWRVLAICTRLLRIDLSPMICSRHVTFVCYR